MGLFDSGIVNFIKLLIIIGLISMLYMIVMQKIKEQNHKISSLLSLVSTMASEITSLKTPEPVCNFVKEDISEDDSDSDMSYSDSEDGKDENIQFFESEIDPLDITNDLIETLDELEPSELDQPVDPLGEPLGDPLAEPLAEPLGEPVDMDSLDKIDTSQSEKTNYKKLNVTQLLELAINKGLTTKEKGEKMKKKDILLLF